MTALSFTRGVGAAAIRLTLQLGHFARFCSGIVGLGRPRRFRPRRLVAEIYDAGVLSLIVICVSGLAVGLVLGLEGHRVLVRYGSEQGLGAAVGQSLVRELGPVLTALLVAGRAGSAMAAEIASMVVTEQLDGLRMMSIDPVGFVLAPKVAAMALVMPLLTGLFILCGISGGYLVGVELLGGDPGSYRTSLDHSVTAGDALLGGVVKAVLFGCLVGLVATYRGFTARPTAAGVSAAATSTVVIASVATLILNYFITAFWDL